jgi:hypothetical protein
VNRVVHDDVIVQHRQVIYVSLVTDFELQLQFQDKIQEMRKYGEHDSVDKATFKHLVSNTDPMPFQTKSEI